MYIIASELYNKFLEIYYEYNELSDNKRNKMDPKYKPKELFLEEYNYDGWCENEELFDTRKTDEKSTDLPPMPPLERKGLKILTRNKLLTRLLILLAQIKQGNNSNKLKNEIR